MKHLSTIVIAAILLVVSSARGRAEQQFTARHGDWTLSADSADKTVAISHSRLGILLKIVQFGILKADEEQIPRSWSIQPGQKDRILIRTSEPDSIWVFELSDSSLRISCTAPSAVLQAEVPFSQDRVVARLMDREGFPVEWAGTGEAAGVYGTSRTRQPSHLPRRNPECMYFALGPLSGGPFHSLFDRATDTAIDFPDQAHFAEGTTRKLLNLTLPLTGSAEIKLTSDYFTKTLGVPFYVRFQEDSFPQPPMVWCSWTSYYSDVTEAAMVANTDWLAEHLKPYGFQYVQLDDGYDRGADKGHYWIEHWDSKKFPHGPQWLTSYIKSKGLHPGLWLVPNSYAGAAESHPQWYLRDKQGKGVQDYRTPALDSSNPEVLDFLKTLFGTLRGWGFDYFKFDGELALPQYVSAVDRGKLYDQSTDPILIYRHRLDVIRDVIGKDTFVEGCPAGTPLNGIGFFNSYFNGVDAYNNWNGMHALFSSINANAFLNRMVVYIMPGEGMELGEHLTVEEAKRRRPASVVGTAGNREDPMIGFGVTTAEARTLVSLVALSGVAYPLAGVMPELPADRLPLLQRTLPTMPIAPVDLFSRGTDIDWDTFRHTTADEYIQHYPEILDLKVNAAAGNYDVLALPNWRRATVTKEVSFTEKLGLAPETTCVAFDSWNQSLLGVFKDHISAAIEGHDTRVILLHRLTDHPQLVGNSRHISGSFSIRDVTWESSRHVLKGTSETIPGRPYSLFFHVPETAALVKAHASTATGDEVQVRSNSKGNLLTVTFEPSSAAVVWEIEFSATAGR